MHEVLAFAGLLVLRAFVEMKPYPFETLNERVELIDERVSFHLFLSLISLLLLTLLG